MTVRKHLVDKNFLKTSIVYRTTKNKRKMIKEKNILNLISMIWLFEPVYMIISMPKMCVSHEFWVFELVYIIINMPKISIMVDIS